MMLIILKTLLFLCTTCSFFSSMEQFWCFCDSAPQDLENLEVENKDTKITKSTASNYPSFFHTKIIDFGHCCVTIQDVLVVSFFVGIHFLGPSSILESYETLFRELYMSSPKAARIINAHAATNPKIRNLVDSFNTGTGN
jgi:hypothetical protein